MIYLTALNSNFEVISTVSYINLTWVRRYYGFGEFTMLLNSDEYPRDAVYLYTPDRPELAVVQKTQIAQQFGGRTLIQVSGYFMEAKLDDKVVYPQFYAGNQIEVAARQMFTTYKEDLPITLGALTNIGNYYVRLQETGAELGTRIKELLQVYQASYKVWYDYADNKCYFQVYKGVDRTAGQTVNNSVVFSVGLGNVTELSYTDDISNEKNYAIVAGEGEGVDRYIWIVDNSGGGYKKKLYVDARDLQRDTTIPEEYYNEILDNRGREKLLDYARVRDFTVSIDPFKKGRAYLTDWDLGDMITAVVEDSQFANIEYSARVTEVTEVIKQNNWTVSISVGDKEPTILNKATR